MPSAAKKLSNLWAVEQTQQSLEFAAVACGGIELEGKSASIKSISECIHCSNASSLSSCFERFSSSFSRISLAGSRRQLSIDKKERNRDSDEPDAPLLGDWELAVEEVDVVIGGEESDEANDTSKRDFNEGFAVEPKPPPTRRLNQFSKIPFHPKQPRPTEAAITLVHTYPAAP